MGGRLAESVAILLLAPLAGLLLIYLRVSLPKSPRLIRWSQRPLGASLLLLVVGLAFYGLYETKPKGTSLLEWITSDFYLASMIVLGLLIPALFLLSGFAIALLALANVAWAGIRLLGRPLRRRRREGPPLLDCRTEQELIEQMHRDLELGRKARTRGEG
ncbi:MAG: hypothetical protein WBQ14_02970 [Gaiellaceae bacterium]